MPTGTYSIDDLIAVRFSSAKALGLNTIAEVLQRDLDAHNMVVEQMVSEMCDVTTDARRIYGTSNAGNMTEVDEFGRAPSQKNNSGVECGFPMKLFQYNLGWTRKFLDNATVGDIVQGVLDAEKAHMQQIQRQIKLAIFGDTNYTFYDHLVDNVALSVRRFVNADSLAIPEGPNGETFVASSHTHFTAATPLVVGNLTTMTATVLEHGHGADLRLAINTAQEAAVRLLAGFTAYIDPRLSLSAASNQPFQRLDVSRLDNRAIGILGGAEVWVKPWVPASYQFVWDAGDARKPLAFRQRNGQAVNGLRIAAEYDTHPLIAQYMEAEFGVGVWTRTNGACNLIGASWSDPAL